MKKTHAILALALLAIFAMGSSAYAVDASAYATATIVDSLQWAKVDDLRFGFFTSPTVVGGGTVVIAANPATPRTVGSGVVAAGGTWGPASFSLNGSSGTTVGISVVESSITLSNGGADASLDRMTVDNFTLSNATKTLSGTATTVTVGGTLSVKQSQKVGAYTASFTVTAVYQ